MIGFVWVCEPALSDSSCTMIEKLYLRAHGHRSHCSFGNDVGARKFLVQELGDRRIQRCCFHQPNETLVIRRRQHDGRSSAPMRLISTSVIADLQPQTDQHLMHMCSHCNEDADFWLRPEISTTLSRSGSRWTCDASVDLMFTRI